MARKILHTSLRRHSLVQSLCVCAEQGRARAFHRPVRHISRWSHLAVRVSFDSTSKLGIPSDNFNSRYKAWRMIGLQPMCAVFYTAGYALREYGAFDYLYSTTNLNIYIISQVLIYICP